MDCLPELYTSRFPEPFEIQICSDIHLESRPGGLSIIPRSSVLALLGDIGYSSVVEEGGYLLSTFLNEQSRLFEYVFFVAGNHEYWHTNITDGNRVINEICHKLDNVIFLNRTAVKLDGYIVCGATLWTRIPRNAWRDSWQCMRDFKVLHRNVRRRNESISILA